jgi:DNA-binding HxlR family transcriptional regulator
MDMIELNNKKYTCPIDVTLSFVDGKWKILILSHLQQFGGRSYADIKKNLPSVSEKMLSQQLKELERDQLIIKNIISEKPYRVEYDLSATGKSLKPLFKFLSTWGIRYLKKNGIDYLKDQHIYK